MPKRSSEKKSQEDALIVQHNDLVEARYHLTLQEKRLMCWLASQVKPMDEDFKEHELSVKEFATLADVKGDHLYKAIDTITHKLMQKIITIRSLEKKEFVKAALLGGVKYYDKQGIVKLSFHPHLKPYMLQLKERFTKISLGEVIGLKSVHTIRIYELLKQYESIGKREILLSDLRNYCGIQEVQYKKFNDLKKDVLERAKNEINAKTDCQVDYKEIKQSRKVIAIEWIIKKQTHFEKYQIEKSFVVQEELQSKNVLVEKLREYGFSRLTAKKFLQQESEEVIENALKTVNLQVERGNVKNPKAMIRTAIQERWKPDVYLSNKTKKIA